MRTSPWPADVSAAAGLSSSTAVKDALDARLRLDAGAGRKASIAAMQGCVLAAGDLVGRFKRK